MKSFPSVAGPNARELYDLGVITNLPEDERLEKHIQQVGIDLSLNSISYIGQGLIVDPIGKKLPPNRRVTVECDEDGQVFWTLQQGVYSIVLNEGCKIPNNMYVQIIQRSTLLRGGVTLVSSIFDPGFFTDNIGTVMVVHSPQVILYQNARVGQAVGFYVNKVQDSDLYGSETKGSSYQNDSQRNQ